MKFLWPSALWLLLVLPLLVAGYWLMQRRRRKGAIRYANVALVREAMGAASWRRHVPPALFLGGLAIALLAVARPTTTMTLPTEHRTIILAIDVSLSMYATDVEPNRIEAAKAAAKAFVQDQPKDVRVGIVSFAGTALLVQPPTNDHDELVAAIDRFELQRHTAIGSGLILSLATLFPEENIDLEKVVLGGTSSREQARSGGRRGGRDAPKSIAKAPAEPTIAPVPPGSYNSAAIILLTDGRRTTGPDPLDAARMAADHGVRVYTVGFGSAEGGTANVEGLSFYMRFDEETLKGIADITKGAYFHAKSGADLKYVYDTLNAKFVMEKKDTEITALLCAVAALLTLAAGTLSLLWFDRIA